VERIPSKTIHSLNIRLVAEQQFNNNGDITPTVFPTHKHEWRSTLIVGVVYSSTRLEKISNSIVAVYWPEGIDAHVK
jgi:hypothetical protein